MCAYLTPIIKPEYNLYAMYFTRKPAARGSGDPGILPRPKSVPDDTSKSTHIADFTAETIPDQKSANAKYDRKRPSRFLKLFRKCYGSQQIC